MLRVTAPLATIGVAKNVRQSAVLRIALLALFWGSSFLWIKLALRGFSPDEVTLARLALGAAVLFPVTAVRREAMPRSPRLWALIVIAALFANVAARRQPVPRSPASTVTYLLPVVSIVLGVVVLGEQVTIPVMAGIALVLAGVALTRARPAGGKRGSGARVTGS